MVDKKAIYNKAIAIYGKPYQTVVAMEELSELIKELSKDIRGKSKKNAIIEEKGLNQVLMEDSKKGM